MMFQQCSYCFPWIFPILFPIIFPILFMFIFRKSLMKTMGFPFGNKDTTHTSQSSGTQSESALEKLKMRLANGEITPEQFKEMKKLLEE